MKKSITRMLSVLMVAVLLLSAAPLNGFVGLEFPKINFGWLKANAADVVDSGTCGTNLTWTLDSDGVLTIEGTGAMANWYYPNYAPWYGVLPEIKSVVIGDNVTSIGSSAFYNCSSLTSVTIPDNVTSIGEHAFSSCGSLTSITIPDSVTSIGIGAFTYCSSLTSINIPDSVTSIGDRAFAYCNSLTSIAIPSSVTSINGSVFTGCDYLENITVDEANEHYSNDSFGVLFNKDKTILIQYPIGNTRTNYAIPDGVTNIDSYAFYYCSSLQSVTIPDNVTSIGEHAFYGCSSLTSITIPDSVTSIGDFTFFQCVSLTSITIPDSVTSIGNYAFYHCSSLTSITIPDSVTSIGYEAFCYCSSLTSITIPDSVTSIGYQAFYNCGSLTSVTIGNSVESIGYWAFGYCSSLTSIEVSKANEQYSSDSFGVLFNKGKTTLILYPMENSRASYNIPDSVTSIGNSAFYYCYNLTSVTIPDSVTSIGNSAFYYCCNLTSVTIGNSVTSIGNSAFSYCSSLISVIIPDSVTSIGWDAFSSCSSLTSVTILNPDCQIDDYSGTFYYFATIYGHAGSTAEAYANKYGRTFVVIGESTDAKIISAAIVGDTTITAGYVMRFTVITSLAANRVRLLDETYVVNEWNEGDSGISVVTSADVKTWTVSNIINTIGENRVLSFQAGDSAAYNPASKAVTFTCVENDRKLGATEITAPTEIMTFVQGNTQNVMWRVDGVTESAGIKPDYFTLNVHMGNELVYVERKLERTMGGDNLYWFDVPGEYFERYGSYTITVTSVKEGYEASDDCVTIDVDQRQLGATEITAPTESMPFVQGNTQNLIWKVHETYGEFVVPDSFEIVARHDDGTVVFTDNRSISDTDTTFGYKYEDNSIFLYNIDGSYFERHGRYRITVTSVKEGYEASTDYVIINVDQRQLGATEITAPNNGGTYTQGVTQNVVWTVHETYENPVLPDSFTIEAKHKDGTVVFTDNRSISDTDDTFIYNPDNGLNFSYKIDGSYLTRYGSYTITVTSRKVGYLPSENSVTIELPCLHENKTETSVTDGYPTRIDNHEHHYKVTKKTVCRDCGEVTKEEANGYVNKEDHNLAEGLLCRCGQYYIDEACIIPGNYCTTDKLPLYWDAGKTRDGASSINTSDELTIIGILYDDNGEEEYYLVEYTITATGERKARFISAEYVKTVAVSGVTVYKDKVQLLVGDSYRLYAFVEPQNAFESGVIWSSENPGIATVTSDGLVTAKAFGTTKIIVTTVDGGKIAECIVTAVYFNDQYSFSKDKWQYKNDEYLIDETMYIICLGPVFGPIRYNNQGGAPQGICYGLSATTAVMTEYPAVVKSFSRNNIIDIDFKDKSNLIGMDALSFNKFSHVYQHSLDNSVARTFNTGLDDLISVVEKYARGETSPVVIEMRPNGHAIYPFDIQYLYSYGKLDEYNILAYDSNCPNIVTYLRISADKKTWDYGAAGLIYGNRSPLNYTISFCQPGKNIYEKALEYTAKKEEFFKYGMKLAEGLFKCPSNMFVSSSNSISFSSSNPGFESYPIYSSESNSNVLDVKPQYWLENVDELTVTTSEQTEVSLLNKKSGIEVVLPENSVCKLTANENSYNRTEFSTTVNQPTQVTFITLDENYDLVKLTVSGTSSSNYVTASEDESGISLFGLSNATVKIVTESGEKTEVVNEVDGVLSINYNKDNSEADFAIDSQQGFEACSCNCHKTGIVKFFFKFILFFQKLFKQNKVCACGINHY